MRRRRGILATLILVVTAIAVEAPLIFNTFWFSAQYYMSGRTKLTFLSFNFQRSFR